MCYKIISNKRNYFEKQTFYISNDNLESHPVRYLKRISFILQASKLTEE